MPKVILRPTVPADIPHLIDGLSCRVKAITAVLVDETGEGKVIGVGGLAFPPNQPPWAFVQQAPEARNYPVAFHRAGLMAMKMIKESGVREVLATCDADNAAAVRWLKRLGFKPGEVQKIPGKTIWFYRVASSQ